MSTLPINLPLTDYTATVSPNTLMSNLNSSDFTSNGLNFTPELYVAPPTQIPSPVINYPLTNYIVTPSTSSLSTTYAQSDIDILNGLRCNGTNNKNFKFNGLTGSYTITFYIKIDSYNNGDWILMQGNPSDSTNMSANINLALKIQNNKFQLSVNDLVYNINNNSVIAPSSTPSTPSNSFVGNWHYISIVVTTPPDSAPGIILYVNGDQYSSGPSASFSKNNIILGGQGTYGNSFTGYIRNFVAYPVALNADSIKYLNRKNNYPVTCTPSMTPSTTPPTTKTLTLINTGDVPYYNNNTSIVVFDDNYTNNGNRQNPTTQRIGGGFPENNLGVGLTITGPGVPPGTVVTSYRAAKSNPSNNSFVLFIDLNKAVSGNTYYYQIIPPPTYIQKCLRSPTLESQLPHSQYIKIRAPPTLSTFTMSFDLLVSSYNINNYIMLMGDTFEFGVPLGNEGVSLSISDPKKLSLTINDYNNNNTSGQATCNVPNNGDILNTPLHVRIIMTPSNGSLSINNSPPVNTGGNSSGYLKSFFVLGGTLHPQNNSFGGTIKNFKITNGSNTSQFTSSIIPELEPFDNSIVKSSNRMVKYSKYYIFMCIAFYAILLLSNKRYDGIITNKKVSFALNILLLICIFIALTN
jgi:hypothetical protein